MVPVIELTMLGIILFLSQDIESSSQTSDGRGVFSKTIRMPNAVSDKVSHLVQVMTIC